MELRPFERPQEHWISLVSGLSGVPRVGSLSSSMNPDPTGQIVVRAVFPLPFAADRLLRLVEPVRPSSDELESGIVFTIGQIHTSCSCAARCDISLAKDRKGFPGFICSRSQSRQISYIYKTRVKQ